MTADEILFREELQTKSREELIETACRLMGELRAAQIRLEETSRGITEMSLQFSQMQDTVRGLESENRFLKEENGRLTAKSTLRTKDVFGRSTEKADDALHIRVADTGVGMQSEELQGLKDKLAGAPSDVHVGIGIGNLYQRLKTLYGEDSLQISSKAGEGTQIDIMIPLSQGGERNAENIDR